MKVTRNKNFENTIRYNTDKLLLKKSILVQGEVIESLQQHNSRASKKPSPAGNPPGVWTGTLSRSIAYKKINDYLYRVGTNVKYGKLHEYGGVTKNGKYYPARPFLRPAYYKLINGQLK